MHVKHFCAKGRLGTKTLLHELNFLLCFYNYFFFNFLYTFYNFSFFLLSLLLLSLYLSRLLTYLFYYFFNFYFHCYPNPSRRSVTVFFCFSFWFFLEYLYSVFFLLSCKNYPPCKIFFLQFCPLVQLRFLVQICFRAILTRYRLLVKTDKFKLTSKSKTIYFKSICRLIFLFFIEYSMSKNTTCANH